METRHGYNAAFHERRAKEEHGAGNHSDAKEHEESSKQSVKNLENHREVGDEETAGKADRDLKRLGK